MTDIDKSDGRSPMPATVAAGSAGPLARSPATGRRVRRFSSDLSAVGEPALWGFGGALALGIILIAGFLAIIAYNGFTTFWPKPIEQVELRDGSVIAGVATRGGPYRVGDDILLRLNDQQREEIESTGGIANRTLYKTANFDLYGDDFRWLSDFEVANVSTPEDFWYFERQVWGVFIGRIAGLTVDGQSQGLNVAQLEREHSAARARFAEIRRLEQSEIGTINHRIERERLNQRRAILRHGDGSPQAILATEAAQARIAELQTEFQGLQAQVNEIRARDRLYRIQMEEVGGRVVDIELSQIVRLFAANNLTLLDKIGIYLSRWWEFVSTEPREA
ncbi:MAG: hypothetical protein ACK4GT_21280, partial [Pararhodobacter sp.]